MPMRSNKIGMVDARRKPTLLMDGASKVSARQTDIINYQVGSLIVAKSDGATHQILTHNDGQFYGQLVNPQRLIGYGKEFQFVNVDNDTFELYKKFLDTRKNRFYEGAVTQYGKAKR